MSKIKYSRLNVIYSSLHENNNIISFNKFLNTNYFIEYYLFNSYFLNKKKRETINCVWKDMLGLVKMWRHIRGYPQGGNTTYTNAKTSRKNKLLLNFRINQFNKIFGNKKRNIYPTLIKAEYNNRLWYYNWYGEWLQANKFSTRMAKLKKRGGIFNPAILASNQTNGYIRTGSASKIGKSKKLVKLFTIGVPVFFTRFIYYDKIPEGFLYRLYLQEEVNRKLGKRLKK